MEVWKRKRGAPKKYANGYKKVTRSVPTELIPALDAWLIKEKAKRIAKAKQVEAVK